MTWFASGNAVGVVGRNLDEDGAIGRAFESLSNNFEIISTVRDMDSLLPVIGRARARWDGESDEAVPPYVSRITATEDRSRLHINFDGDRAAADPTFAAFVAPAGSDELTITFVDDGQGAVIASPWDEPSPGRVLLGSEFDTYALVDAFIGEGTTRQTALARIVNGVAHFRLRLRGRAAVLMGTPIRIAASSRASRDRDPFWRDRLTRLEQDPRYGELATKHPQLKDAGQTSAPISVLVHGTFSSCVSFLPDLSDLTGGTPLYRFEHDTMRPVTENADELVVALKKVGSPNVTLLAHSRGGLVGAIAAHDMATVNKVLTFGTPHNGTPIVSSLDNLLGYATTAAALQMMSVVEGGLTAAHFGSALPGGQLPDGWTDMLPHASPIQLLRRIDRSAVTAFGGDFDGRKPELGTGPAFKAQVIAELMQGKNDLVVPTSSSKPASLPGMVLAQVDHFSYFKDQTVKDAIHLALTAPMPAPAPHTTPWHFPQP